MPDVEKKEQVMEMVRQELSDDPDAENRDLYQKAKKIDPAVDDLSLRQFHARYPLQVKRKMAQKRRDGESRAGRTTSTARGRGGEGSADRETIRSTLLRFARDVSAAEGKAEMIDILSNVDEYVDEVVDSVGGD